MPARRALKHLETEGQGEPGSQVCFDELSRHLSTPPSVRPNSEIIVRGQGDQWKRHHHTSKGPRDLGKGQETKNLRYSVL